MPKGPNLLMPGSKESRPAGKTETDADFISANVLVKRSVVAMIAMAKKRSTLAPWRTILYS